MDVDRLTPDSLVCRFATLSGVFSIQFHTNPRWSRPELDVNLVEQRYRELVVLA
jgi:hypothetical protein